MAQESGSVQFDEDQQRGVESDDEHEEKISPLPTLTLLIDPFGNILGVMHNPHYLEVLARRSAS